jgi:NADH:ubiquinone oxidoreductase subunit 5 (subunit L)/multisubunit Na+/H+ antiporter MnhA subunit
LLSDRWQFSFLYVVAAVYKLYPLNDNIRGAYFTWLQSGFLQVGFDLVLDRLTAVMLLIVTGVGLLIHIYAVGYMAHEGGYYRFFSYLNLFMFFMLVLVLAANLPADVCRLGRRGTLQLPAGRVLLHGRSSPRRRE